MTDTAPSASALPQDPPRLGLWILLFGSFSSSAGHGVFLLFALQKALGVQNVKQLGGPVMAVVVCWFVACLLLAPLAWLLRRPLLRSAGLGPISLGAALVTLCAFALYVRAIVLG
jgi:hypothetical protein